MRSFSIDLNNHRYTGLWKLKGEDLIEVRSDYGSTTAACVGRDPGVVAREVLRALVTRERVYA